MPRHLRNAALLVALMAACAIPAFAQPAGPAGAWTVKAPMPAIRNEVAAAAVNGRLYVFGGSVGGGRYDLTRNEEYDPATNAWRARKDLPSGANHMAAAAANGKIYLVGGFLGSQHKDAGDRWPRQRSQHGRDASGARSRHRSMERGGAAAPGARSHRDDRR